MAIIFNHSTPLTWLLSFLFQRSGLSTCTFFFKKICVYQKKVVTLQPNSQTDIQTMKAKPFVKWVGGKTQLIEQLEALLPADFDKWENVTYIEPFVGGGAMIFR